MTGRSLPHLTATDFYKYLKCPNWVYWDCFGDPKEKREASALVQKLREDGVLHEREVIEGLGAFEEMPGEGTPEEHFAETVKAMKRGALIYQGTLMHGDWVGRPDLLRPVAQSSHLGEWSYEAVDIKNAREPAEAHKFQLFFYGILLEHVQGHRPDEGYIVNSKGEEIAIGFEESEASFFKALDGILEIRAGKKPDPFMTSSCKDSPWFHLCKREAESADDPSLIYKLYKSEYKKLKEGGYATLTSIASSELDALVEGVHGISAHRLERIRTQAQSWAEKRIIRVDDPRLPEETREIYFDIEGDPLIGIEYLFGILVREPGKVEYLAFLAEKPEDEGKAWTDFCDHMEKLSGTVIYHYGRYELDVIARMSSRYGISKKAGHALDPKNMIDLLRVVQRAAVFPMRFYSLKDIAKWLGFKWRADDASGANSVVWFQNWLDTGDRDVLQKIVDYNEDDVRATMLVKEWLVNGE